MEVTAVSDAAQRPALPEATSNEIPPLLLAGIGINNPLEARNISSEKKKKDRRWGDDALRDLWMVEEGWRRGEPLRSMKEHCITRFLE